jgi:hypothetical protein
MNDQLKGFIGRTDAKLGYAELTLVELENYTARSSGNDFERSHHEAYLFHLYGVVDALLQEINQRYACGLQLHEVGLKKLQSKMQKEGAKNAALDAAAVLLKDEASWLYQIKEYRDHGTHRQSIPRTFHVGGENDGQVWFKDPPMDKDVLTHFREWLMKMAELIKLARS